MPSSYIIGGGFDYSINTSTGKWSWQVVSNTIQSASVYFYVSNIMTPFGKLTDVDIPIPYEVISAMNDTLNQFVQQLSPTLTLASNATVSLTVSEGTGVFSTAPCVVSNTGAMGSILNVGVSTDVPWLTASPASLTGIQKQQTGSSVGRVNSTDLLSSDSPYVGHLIFTNNANPSNAASVSVQVNVLPRPTIMVNTFNIVFTYNTQLQAVESPQMLTVTNIGPATSLLNYQINKIQNASPWLVINPISGGPLASNVQEGVLLSLNSLNLPRTSGTYTETLAVVSQNATNTPQLVHVTLVVT